MRTGFKATTARRYSIRRRSGYTLVELVVATIATGILLAGMTSAIFVAARAAGENLLPSGAIQGSATVEDIVAELRLATSFTERSASSIEFTVADRDADETPETIRYEWSGTPGDPLKRTYNGGNTVVVLDNVHEFQLAYYVQTVGESPAVYYLDRIDLTMQAGSDSMCWVATAAEVLNAPEVAAP